MLCYGAAVQFSGTAHHRNQNGYVALSAMCVPVILAMHRGPPRSMFEITAMRWFGIWYGFGLGLFIRINILSKLDFLCIMNTRAGTVKLQCTFSSYAQTTTFGQCIASRQFCVFSYFEHIAFYLKYVPANYQNI